MPKQLPPIGSPRAFEAVARLLSFTATLRGAVLQGLAIRFGNETASATSSKRFGMIVDQMGGCLCGEVRYKALSEPVRVTICHCTFCQRITGSAFLVEPVFRKEDVVFSGASLKTYDHRSDTSRKRVSLNFCGKCGTTIYLDLERFPDIVGLFGGTFDNPNWFDRGQGKCRHIFTRSAQDGVLIPANVDTFTEHALEVDGTPNKPIVLAHALAVSRKQ